MVRFWSTQYLKLKEKCQHAVDSFLLGKKHALVAKGNIGQFYKNVFKTAFSVRKDDYGTIPYDDKAKAECFGNYIESFFCKTIIQEAQLSQRDRAAACLNFGKKYKCEKRASNIALYVTALTSTNHHFTVLHTMFVYT